MVKTGCTAHSVLGQYLKAISLTFLPHFSKSSGQQKELRQTSRTSLIRMNDDWLPPTSSSFSSSASSLQMRLFLLLFLVSSASAFFGGGDCCCCDCCCDCCCGCCAPPLLLAIPCCSSCNSYGTYGGAIFGRRRKRELYARTGARSADFLNDHRCADRFWLKLLERKKALEGRVSSTEKVYDKVPEAKAPRRDRYQRNTAASAALGRRSFRRSVLMEKSI